MLNQNLTEEEKQAAMVELKEIAKSLEQLGIEIEKQLNEALKELEYRRSLGENI